MDNTTPALYERLIHFDEDKNVQFKLMVNTFRGIEYLQFRKYYQDFDEEWKPSVEGVSIPLDFDNSRELFAGLVDILSLAETKNVLEKEFKEQLDQIYLK